MNIGTEIDKLLGSEHESIARAAGKLQSYKQALDNKELSESEFKDLVNDLRLSSEIQNLASDLEHKIMLEQACNLLITAAGSV
jgi:hypothetical protein